MKILATVEGEDITEHDDGRVTFRSCARVDTDGTGPLHGDKYAQAETSLKPAGRSLNADLVPYVVAHPDIVRKVHGVVLGCHCVVTYKGRSAAAVAGDVGPKARLGEISVALALALGINPSPINGGVDAHVVDYQMFPGRSAVVNGVTYALQRS